MAYSTEMAWALRFDVESKDRADTLAEVMQDDYTSPYLSQAIMDDDTDYRDVPRGRRISDDMWEDYDLSMRF